MDTSAFNICLSVLLSLAKLSFSIALAGAQSLSEGSLLTEGASFVFQVLECNPTTCPGSAYNLITAAWANIGYLTHADFLHLVNDTGFGTWAPLLYVLGAIGGLMGIVLNSPPRNYAWFMIGPGIFSFLVGTTTEVTGVAWRVAGRYQPMAEVWKDAETGVGNTYLVKRLGLSVTKTDGPSGQYPVAWTLVFLDGLFSATTNRVVSWIGIGSQEGTGGSDTNLAKKDGDGEGPWYILANLKWNMLANIVGVTARDPDVRDALVTFLSSECGDHFKKGIDSGSYAAASMSRGSSLPDSVLKSTSSSSSGGGSGTTKEFDGSTTLDFSRDYEAFIRGLDTDVIPTPRSLIRLFNQPKNTRGSFRDFAAKWRNNDRADESGRTVEIVCSEYLWTVLQALRWESGHAYWQLVRSSPNGFTRMNLLKSIFYGWDIRKTKEASYASDEDLEAFVKQLIFLHLVKNELLFAPQITETGQRFAPSEQTRGYTEAYVRDQGAKNKGAELYNWAVMMPHLQGILTYLVYIAYPFSVMLMVIPGYWKAFFTWITFLAWVKTWDIGFAIVHTLERSVWAIIGNHSSMARVANGLIQTAEHVGVVQVGKDGACNASTDKLSELCAIPDVQEGSVLSQPKAWALLDKTLLLMGSADLDLSNGYYIYIMSALYFAIPAVTGQLVLGAKAGLGSIATQGLQAGASEAGNAAKSGAVGEATNRIATNQQSLGGAAVAKSHRQTGLALQQLEAGNAALDSDLSSSRISGTEKGLESAAKGRELAANSFSGNIGVLKNAAGTLGQFARPSAESTGAGSGATGGLTDFGKKLAAKGIDFSGGVAGSGAAYAGNSLTQAQYGAAAKASGFGANAAWDTSRNRLVSAGLGNYGQKLGAEAEFAAQSAAWDARNEFATHMAGIGGVAGYNAGSLAPGQKPTDVTGLAMSGQLGQRAEGAARYSGFGFLNSSTSMTSAGRQQFGSSMVGQTWGGGFDYGGTVGFAASTPIKDGVKALEKLGD